MKKLKTFFGILILVSLFINCKDETTDTPENEFKEYVGDVVLTTKFEVDTFGANNYTNITGSLTIYLDLNTDDLSPLLSLNSIGESLNIYFSNGLRYTNGLNNISSIGGDLEIVATGILRNLDGLSSLTSIGGQLLIDENIGLKNLDGLSSLTFVGGDFRVAFNYNLSDLCGLTNLLTNSNLTGSYYLDGNSYNPSQQDIIDGNCAR